MNRKLIYFFILFFIIFSLIRTNQIFALGNTASEIILKGITSEHENVYVNKKTPKLEGIDGEIIKNKSLFTMYFKDINKKHKFSLDLDIKDDISFDQSVSGIEKIELMNEDGSKNTDNLVSRLDKKNRKLELNTGDFQIFKHDNDSQKIYKVRFTDKNEKYSEILFYAVKDNTPPNFSPYEENYDGVNSEGNLDFLMYKNIDENKRDSLFLKKNGDATKNLKEGEYIFKLNLTDNSILSKATADYKSNDIAKYNAGLNLNSGNLEIKIQPPDNINDSFFELKDRFVNKNIESEEKSFKLETDGFQKKYKVIINSIIGNGKEVKDKLCDAVGNCMDFSGLEIKIGEQKIGGEGIQLGLSPKNEAGGSPTPGDEDEGGEGAGGSGNGGLYNKKMIADGVSKYAYNYDFSYLNGKPIIPLYKEGCIKRGHWDKSSICLDTGIIAEDRIIYNFIYYNGLNNGQQEDFDNNGTMFKFVPVMKNENGSTENIKSIGNKTIIFYPQYYNKKNLSDYGKNYIEVSSLLPTFGGYPYVSYKNRLYLEKVVVIRERKKHSEQNRNVVEKNEIPFSKDFNKENFLKLGDGYSDGFANVFSTKDYTNKDFIDKFYEKSNGYGKIDDLKEELPIIRSDKINDYKIEYDFYSPVLHYNVGLGDEDESSGTGDKDNNTFDLIPIKTINTINSYKKYIKNFSKKNVSDIKIKERFLMGMSKGPYNSDETVNDGDNGAKNEFSLLNKQDSFTGIFTKDNNIIGKEREIKIKLQNNNEDKIEGVEEFENGKVKYTDSDKNFKKGVDFIIKLQPKKDNYDIAKNDNLRLGYVSFITYKLGNKKITLPSISRNITKSGEYIFDEKTEHNQDITEKDKPDIYPGKKPKSFIYNPRIDSIFYPVGYNIKPDPVLDGGYLASMGIGVVGLQKAGETMLGKNSKIDKNTVRISGLDNAFSKTREVLYRNINKYDTSVLEAEKQKRNNIKWCKANTSDKYFKIGNNELNLTPDDSINLNNSIDKCTIKNGENEYITFIDSNVVFDCGDGQNCLLNNKEVGTRSFVIRGASYIKSNISTFENKKDNGKGIFISTIAQDNLEKVGSGLLDKNNPTIAPRKGWTFVDPRVTNIDAFIYSDGPVVSGSGNKSLTKNEMQLFNQPTNKDLNNQLHIYGALISTNTVGGYRGGEKNRVCPNFTLLKGKDCSGNASFIFDLSMLRRYSTESRIGKYYIKVRNKGLASGGKKKIMVNKILSSKPILKFNSRYFCENELRCIRDDIDLTKYPLVIERNPNWDKNPSFLFKIDY